MLEPVLTLQEISTGLYIAFSAQTDDSVVAKAVEAYQELKAEGEYEKTMSVIKKYKAQSN